VRAACLLLNVSKLPLQQNCTPGFVFSLTQVVITVCYSSILHGHKTVISHSLGGFPISV